MLVVNTRSAMLAGTAMLAVFGSGAAFAQSTGTTAQNNAFQEEEIVITATRQADTVNRVALSVSAVTQRQLDQRSVGSVADFAATVPSVTFRGTGSGDSSISIRGIVSGLGAATTGVYLDDTPIQRRLANGVGSGNGNAYPQLFDLDRIEVLRGPQGTLYGGSSQGGTIRFLTPQPSLTTFSTYSRGSVSATEGGEASYGLGVAVGGPLIEDKLGFRVAVEYKRNGGYIDHVSIYDGSMIAENTNDQIQKAVRLSLAWAPTERLRITPSYYTSKNEVRDSDVFWENVPEYRVTGGTFNNSGTIHGVPYSFPNTTFAGFTQEALNQFGPFRTPVAYYATEDNPELQTQPRTVSLDVASLTLDYELDDVSLKSITSYVRGKNEGYTSGQFGIRPAVLPNSVTGRCGQGQPALNYNAGCTPLLIPGFPQQYSKFDFVNKDRVFIQELRLATNPNAGPLSVVAGLYHSNSRYNVNSDQVNNENELTLFLRGMEEAYFVGQRVLPNGVFAHREINIHEREFAGFGELTYKITERLKAIAGVRVSHHMFDYEQTTAGPVFAPAFGFQGTLADPFPNATNGNGGYVTVSGGTRETPITPKFGLSWQATDRQLLYFTVSKGYRAGGVNVPANPVQCALGLTALGGNPPDTYTSDTVWSYEAGSKSGLFNNRVQVNASVFRIKWTQPQISQAFPTCGYSYIANAGEAVSQGGDVQVVVRVLNGLTLDGSVAYTDAHYTQTVKQPGGTSSVVNEGDELGAPKWQYNLAAQYTLPIADDISAYVRGDYRYSGAYQRGSAAGTPGYDPIIARGGSTQFATARIGVTTRKADISVFVNNLTNSQDRIFQGHASAQALVTATTFRPREFGLQLTHRY